MADIFISYAREDSERIKLLASGLASHGRSVFWDRTIPPGKTWRNWIGKALAEARCVVVAWSEASIQSEWVYEEAEEGKERNILVPVFLGNVRPPMGFRAIQGATLVDWNGGLDDQSFQQLANAVADILGPVETAPENSLQKISTEPVVSTPPVDLHVAETTPAQTAAQSVETPREAQAGQLRGTSRNRGHRWLWIAGALLLPVLYAVWEFAIPPKPATVGRQPTVSERVDPRAQQEPVRPAIPTPKPVAPPTPSPEASDSGAEVRELLNAAERDLTEQRLTSPESRNAVKKYRRVLVLDPANENAKRGLGRVVEKYREMFETKLEAGDLKGARKPLKRAADVLPESKVVNEMRDRLKLAEAEPAKRSEETPVVSAPASARGLTLPEMIEIPAGSFNMGSPRPHGNVDERPVHRVTIQRFALGRFEVTFAEYDAFALATGRALPNDEGWGRDKRPVIKVSWNDAQAYAQWLSERTGKRYRLPTESEWEYAARAKTTTARFWGDDPAATCQYANVDDADPSYKCKDGYEEYTAPVGTFKANDFGAYDMLGNAWEWVQDCYHENYRGAPMDGAAWEDNGCDQRVRRGGAWNDDPIYVRSAYRVGTVPDYPTYDLGFRLAQDK